MVVQYRPDDPLGPLVDDLVTDLIAYATEDAREAAAKAEERFRKVAEDPRLQARYGDFNLGVTFGGVGGRTLRADVARALTEKGLSQRAIAKQLGVSQSTVRDDLSSPTQTPSVDVSSPTRPDESQPDDDEQEESLEDFAAAIRTPPEARRAALNRFRSAVSSLGVAFHDIDPPPTKDEVSESVATMTDVLHRLAGETSRLEVVK